MSVKKVKEGVFDIYIRLGRVDRIRKRIKCASQLDALAIETFKAKRLQAGRKINRQGNLELLCLSSMLKWGYDQGLCNEPMKKMSPLPYYRKIPEIPSPDEIEKIIENTSGLFHKSLFLALYHAGLRSQEARSLKWGDIDFDNGWLRVANGKGGMQRIVPLSSRLSELLQEHQKKSVGVFCMG